MKIGLPDIRIALLLTGFAGFAGNAVAAFPDDSELCEPFADNCMADLPVLGPIIQGAFTDVYLAATGGEVPTVPPEGVPPELPPVEPPAEGPPQLCDPFDSIGCISDLDDFGIPGSTIQAAIDTVYFAVTGGEPPPVEPPEGLPPVELPPSTGNDSGQRGVVGAVTDFVADVMEIVGSLSSGSAQAVLGFLQQPLLNLANNIRGVLLEDDDASVATTARNAADNPQGDGAGTVDDLVRDVGRVLFGFAPDSNIRAGVGVVDMTPDVGYAAGQYADTTDILDGLSGGEIDPYLTHKSKKTSYGVQSRLTARAIVVEGNNGKRVVMLKTDNYLAQDALIRRVAQILQAEGSSIGYEQILHSATHNHSSAYSSTPSWGVWVFEDVFDPRFFENQARKMTRAIQIAENNLKPARMGATTVRHKIFKGNVVRLSTANDGTPAGYPLEYGDLGLVVMRFDDLTGNGPKPLAVWVNWGQHPESLEGHDLHTADYLSALERFVEREIGAPLVFSQGDVGSAENSGNKTQMHADDGTQCGTWAEGAPAPSVNNCGAGEGVLRVFNHLGYNAFERNVRFLADDVIKGWDMIGAGHPSVQVALSDDFPVDYRNYWAPGPLSHPYPSVSNCKTDTTVEGDVGVPIVGLPDCGRFGFPGENEVSGQAAVVYATMKAEGVPVPDHYDAPAFTGVEENLRIYLQTFRLGEVLLASCACEAQMDLILNLESRADQVPDNIYNGFDWACLIDGHKNDPQYANACAIQQQYYDPVEFPTGLSGTPAGRADGTLIAHMRAQIHNDARGWDAPEYVLQANSEPFAAAGQPTNFSAIKGNFTHEELLPQHGYKLPVGLGHSGDYVGYTVSYREYMNRDSYRKALTAYGAHTADYMVTRLVRMAGAMKGAPELLPEPHDALAQADEARQVAQTTVFGQATAAAYDAWQAALPMDVGPAQKLAEPSNISHFKAATFRWRGGNTQLDNPVARVDIQCDAARNYLTFQQPLLQARCAVAGNGAWVRFADMTGEVQTRVHWPLGVPGAANVYAGQFSWEWTANFEAYRAFPARLGSTPLGSYRFVVNGCINDGVTDPASNGQGRAESLLKALLPDAAHAPVEELLGNGCAGGSRPYEFTSNSFTVSQHLGPIPRSYASSFPYVQNRADNAEGDSRICETCSFRPWANDTFGGAVFDNDGDGVIEDGTDLCPNTPAGQPVNANGCSASQLDADGDGVPDASDTCPNTPAGTPVTPNGCPVPTDTTPNAFGFTSVSGVSQSTVVSSNVVTINGIDAPAPISVDVGEYRINGGAYTSASGTITNGQTVQVRHTSAATANTVTETVLNIGGVVGKFRSTTAAGGVDTDPDAFGFVTQTGVMQNTAITSNTITPVGYTATTTVKAGAGTQYNIGCTGVEADWTSAQGTISPGTSICVRHTSASTANTLKKTSLQLGKTVGYFSTRTAP